MIKLIRTNEIHYFYVLSQLFQISCNDEILIKLAEKTDFSEEKSLARLFMEKIKGNCDKKEIYMRKLEGFSKKNEDFIGIAKDFINKFNYYGGVLNNILGGNDEESFKIAVDFAKNCISSRNHQKLHEIFSLFEILPYENLKEIKNLQ